MIKFIRKLYLKYFHKCKFDTVVRDIFFEPYSANEFVVKAAGVKLGRIRQCECGRAENFYFKQYISSGPSFVTEDDFKYLNQ